MFKLVVLFSVVAFTAAQSRVGPASFSAQNSYARIVPGRRVPTDVTNRGVHTIAKRSVVAPLTYTSVVSPVSPPYTHIASVAPVTPFVRNTYTPVAYSSPYVSAYTAPGYGYSAVVPKAYSVHPW